MALLSARALTVNLSTPSGPIPIVSGIDIDIPHSTIFGLVGESGCGKSLTALALMGLLPQSMSIQGSIRFKGTELVGMPEAQYRDLRGREIAMIFQEPMTSLNPVLRIGYQIREVITAHLKIRGKEADEMVLGLLRAVRIPSPEVRAREYPHQMSGGMRQRVMIAMSIACSPSLLIADEPTTALDVTIQAQILELLQSLRREKEMAMLFITHDLAIVAENAERAAIMYAGRIVEVADVRDLFDSPMHPYTIGLLQSLPSARGITLKPIPGFVPKPGELPAGCAFSDRCMHAIGQCSSAEPGLAEVAPGHLVRCIRAGEIGP